MSEVLARAPSRVSFDPAPPWADLPQLIPAERAALERSDGGRCFWLSDAQIRLEGGRHTWLNRMVSEVTSPAGLQEAGALSLDFDPAFQELSIHFVRVIRDGVVRDVDVARGLELLRRERDLERAVFDGRLTAHLSIPDVRVGDVVDVCHSVVGQNPVLRDHFAAEWRFAWSCWVGETRVRLLAPADRQLQIKSWNAPPECVQTRRAGGEVERVWRAVSTEPVIGEAVAPGWVRQVATVRVCDVLTWADVADAFRPYYEPQSLPPDLEAAAGHIEAEHAEPADRAVAALRLVQSSLRYQSVTIGDGGFVPRDLATIWASRTGDCKDSSRLLAALLRRLGLAADAALVNTWRGPALAEEAPSLVAFDHCIVVLALEGRRYWLDPTSFPQGGRLDALAHPRFGLALPLVEGAALEDMGEEALADCLTTTEVYELPADPNAAGRLRVDTTHYGWRADLMRRRLANGIATVTREFLNFYEERYGKVSALEPLQVTDDLEANSVRIVESYEVARLWQYDAESRQVVFETYDDLFRLFMPGLAPDETRTRPIDLGRPLRANSTIEIRPPIATPVGEWDQGFQASGLSAASKLLSVDGLALRLERSLVFEKPVVDAQRLKDYATFREDALRYAGVRVHHAVRNGRIVATKAQASAGPFGKVLWWIVAAFWILAVLSQGGRFLSGLAGS